METANGLFVCGVRGVKSFVTKSVFLFAFRIYYGYIVIKMLFSRNVKCPQILAVVAIT